MINVYYFTFVIWKYLFQMYLIINRCDIVFILKLFVYCNLKWLYLHFVIFHFWYYILNFIVIFNFENVLIKFVLV